ncbi:tetratricopeptide repeat protein [Ancylomarina salipaludis]|uniref:Tetratricopeptide repeat protein n=1 Tax=Ancylomarina salipaludis TaxID=2501299 RepID=A0A4Q1JQ50_9BACT|nr:tetratricopeptide repeat protein [Ancylomarina salipaludis]RXQ97542.1 tetratricopeptide repeat protein [Ancylomarina salipaludis]
MRTIILKYKHIAFLIVILSFFSISGFTQEKCTVKGNVTVNEGDLSNVKVTLYKDSQQVGVRDISKNGKFSYELDFGYDYIFEFSKTDFVTKRVSVSTYVPQEVLERDSRFPPCKFSIELFRFFPGIDLSVFDQPIGMIMYNRETDLIETDLSFQTEIEAELKRIEKETRLKQEAYMAELARVNTAFNLAIKNADSEFQKKNYIESKSLYTEASQLKPNEEYPKTQILKIDDILLKQKGQLEAQRLVDEKYKALIDLADKFFAENNYEQAKINYQSALEVKKVEAYPQEQLAKIKALELEQKQNAENEARRLAAEKVLNEQYAKLIESADEAFDLKQYETAKSHYTAALKLKSDEVYPQNQIQEIDNKLDYLKQMKAANEKLMAEKKALRAEYDRIIKLADSQFKKKDYNEALGSYTKALELNVEEAYPQSQIQKINEAIAQEKELAANLLQQKELDEKYAKFIDLGDTQLKEGEYVLAKTNYTQALVLKPNETHPKAQLVKIESLMAHQAKILAEKNAREKRYADLIALADSQMNSGDFDKALGNYEQALGFKPKAEYLKEQVIKAKQAQIDKKHEEEEKQKQERELKLLSQKYNDLIAKGDKNLVAKKYFDSRDNFRNALEIKPNEKYPKEQLNKIEELLAKELHQETARKEFEAKYEVLITTGDSQLQAKDYVSARKSYKSASVMKPEESYPILQLKKMEGLIAEASRIKAEEKMLDEKYGAFINQADQKFKAKDYEKAILDYQSAIDLKPNENYPKEQIASAKLALDEMSRLADKKLKEENQKKVLEENYLKAISLADDALNKDDFKQATTNYKQALEYKSGDQYATAQLLKIQTLIAEKESQAKADELLSKKKAILEKKFRSFISEGDKFFRNEKYSDALGKYEAAIQIYRNDEYTLKQITLVNEKLAEEKVAAKEQLELSKQYETILSRADKLFADKDLKSAKEAYLSALKLKSREVYPKNQIAIIDASLAKQIKLDRKNSQIEKEFKETLAIADSHFKKELYSLARHHYKLAQKIKPDDAYIKSQLEEIEMRLKASMQSDEDKLFVENSNAFGDNLLKKKEQDYKAFVDKGDEAIKGKYLGKAKAYYKKALDIFERDYPKEKLVEIEKLKSAFRSEKEREEFERLLKSGDDEFAKKNFSVARHYYHKAMPIATDKSLIDDKLEEIEQAIEIQKQEAIDEEFNLLTKKGNAAFKDGNLSIARFYYQKALEIKPMDKELKENLETIKKTLK